MWTDLLNWWYSLWADAAVVGGAVAGFVSALTMFLIGDVIWKSRIERVKSQAVFRQQQLDKFYAPLYRFYRESYTRFDLWKKEHPDSRLARQPFFESDENEVFAERIFAQHPGCASQTVLRLWSSFRASTDKNLRNTTRHEMIIALIKDYQLLRKQLGLDYSKSELKRGEFNGDL